MATDIAPPAAAERRPGKAQLLARFGLIGVALGAIVGGLAYLRGWLTPGDLTPGRFTDAFEEANGLHPGYRRNHAKGVGVAGYFEGNGQGERLSKAFVFRQGRVPVVGRFSLGGGQPHAADKPDAVRGLGLQFTSPSGEVWRTAMINLPVFPFRTPEAFYEQLVASKPDPATGKPDPNKMHEFLARHPETARALGVIKGHALPSGFGDSTFHGLNAFQFVDAVGNAVPVRWVLTPEQPVVVDTGAPQPRDNNYLFDTLVAQLRRQPLRWHLVVVVGEPGDPTNDATIPWPADRERVDVGTLTLDQVEGGAAGSADDIVFDPLVLPAGITPSDDPLLSARSAVYMRSFTRRAGETK